MKNEEWKEITGYEGLYKISDTGKVFSLISNRILKHNIVHGYHHVNLYKNKNRKFVKVHRLVAQEFLGFFDLEINHIDGNKTNNKVLNLEWCDRSHNMQHAHTLGLVTVHFGENNTNSKLKDSDVIKIKKLIKNGVKNKDIAIKFKVDRSLISHIKRGYVWSHILLSEE